MKDIEGVSLFLSVNPVWPSYFSPLNDLCLEDQLHRFFPQGVVVAPTVTGWEKYPNLGPLNL